MSSGIIRTYHKENCDPIYCVTNCKELSGTHISEEYFQNNGKIEGIYKVYHSNGQIYKKFNYIDGKLNGIGEFFKKDGRIHEEQFYINGILQKYKNYIYYVDGGLYEVKEVDCING